MDARTRHLIEDLYRRVRCCFGDAVFAEATLRGRGAPPAELEAVRARIGALGEVLDLFDTIMNDPPLERRDHGEGWPSARWKTSGRS